VKPTTTSRRNAAPLTTHETEKSSLTKVPLSPVARVTHGSHPRAAGTHDGGSPTDASPSQPDTKKCIQVGRETYAVTSQPGTSYTFDRGIDTATCGARVGRETIALPPIGTFQVQRPQPVTHPAEHTNQQFRSGSLQSHRNLTDIDTAGTRLKGGRSTHSAVPPNHNVRYTIQIHTPLRSTLGIITCKRECVVYWYSI
jgi:hypothetical protein